VSDFDQQTPHSDDVLLRRDPPPLTRVTSSDHDDNLDFDTTVADHDDDEEEPPGYIASVCRMTFQRRGLWFSSVDSAADGSRRHRLSRRP